MELIEYSINFKEFHPQILPTSIYFIQFFIYSIDNILIYNITILIYNIIFIVTFINKYNVLIKGILIKNMK